MAERQTRRGFGVGAHVRTADREALQAVLLDPAAARHPRPEQFVGAGRTARVVSVRLDGGAPLYTLDRIPGDWPAEWLEPA